MDIFVESQSSGTADCRSPGLEQVGLTEGRPVLSPRGAGSEGEESEGRFSERHSSNIAMYMYFSGASLLPLSGFYKGKEKQKGMENERCVMPDPPPSFCRLQPSPFHCCGTNYNTRFIRALFRQLTGTSKHINHGFQYTIVEYLE